MALLYRVTKPFNATVCISGRERRFQLDETFLYDTEQAGDDIMIEADYSLFLVDRSILETCSVFLGSFDTLVAIDRGIKAAEEGRTVPLEEVRRVIPEWIRKFEARNGLR